MSILCTSSCILAIFFSNCIERMVICTSTTCNNLFRYLRFDCVLPVSLGIEQHTGILLAKRFIRAYKNIA